MTHDVVVDHGRTPPTTESRGLRLLQQGLASGDPRATTLEAAACCVLADRQQVYSGPEDNFGTIAALWADYLRAKRPGPLVAHDVAAMMILMKVARLAVTPNHRDSWVDTAGYAACGARCADVLDSVQAAPPEGAACDFIPAALGA